MVSTSVAGDLISRSTSQPAGLSNASSLLVPGWREQILTGRIRRRFGFGYRISASWCLPCSRPESLRPRSSCASVTIPLCEPACRPLKSPVAWFFPGTPVARRSAEASVARRFLKFVSALWRPRLPGVPSIRRSVCNSGCPWLLPFRLRFFLDLGCPLPLNRRSGSPWTPVARCPRSPFPMLLKPRLPGAS
jgi:hypothetical protein